MPGSFERSADLFPRSASLPEAGYEFKYLLKLVQISRTIRPGIILVTGGKNTDATYSNYQKLFGRVMDKKDG